MVHTRMAKAKVLPISPATAAKSKQSPAGNSVGKGRGQARIAASASAQSLKTYFISSDDRVVLLDRVGLRKEPEPVVLFSTLEEFTAATSNRPMQLLVRVWNNLPGARSVTRFQNRRIACERIWLAMQNIRFERDDEQRPPRPKKQATVMALLEAPEGATLAALMEATGWQAHSVRGFLSRKISAELGIAVESFRRDGERVYRISRPPTPAFTQNEVAALNRAE